MPKTSSTAILTDIDLVAHEAPLDESYVLYTAKNLRGAESQKSLAAERRSITFEFETETGPAYAIVGMYEDNTPAELIIHAPQTTHAVAGLLNVVGEMASNQMKNASDLATIISPLLKSTHEVTREVGLFLQSRFTTQITTGVDSLSKPVVVELVDKEVKE